MLSILNVPVNVMTFLKETRGKLHCGKLVIVQHVGAPNNPFEFTVVNVHNLEK